MTFAGCWGLLNSEPIIPYIISSFIPSNQDVFQSVIRWLGVVLIIVGIVLLYYIHKLPSDSKANDIAKSAMYIRKAIIDLSQLYDTFVDKVIVYTVNDYLPYIKDDTAFQKDFKLYKDRGLAARSYIALNPQNPIMEDLKNGSERWIALNNDIKKAAMLISDKKLFAYLRSYKNTLENNGLSKIKVKVTLSENPVTNYTYRNLGNLNQYISDTNVEDALLKLNKYLDELIIEYSEEVKSADKFRANIH
jgi:hypothetical protein